jgi:hypothetical protein
MTKQNFVKTGSSKKEQNEVARYLAVRSSDRILYDPKQLLVIDENNLVEELQVIEDEDLEYGDMKIVRVVFSDRVNDESADEKAKFTMDITTSLTLSQFERKLAKCNNESEVEDLCE